MQGYLRHLANFVEITRSGSLSAAAERQGTAVSVMSRSMAILENHYGFQLALRTSNGLVLTEKGRLVHDEAIHLVSAARRALAIGHKDLEAKGEVVISAPREVLQLWLLDCLVSMISEFPKITYRIAASDEVLDTRRQRIDVVLRISGQSPPSDLDVFFERPVQPILVGRPELVAQIFEQLEEQVNIPLIRFRMTSTPNYIEMKTKNEEKIVRKSFKRITTVSDAVVAIELAKKGVGVVSCLAPSIRKELKNGELVEVFPYLRFDNGFLRLGFPKGTKTAAAEKTVGHLASELSFLE